MGTTESDRQRLAEDGRMADLMAEAREQIDALRRELGAAMDEACVLRTGLRIAERERDEALARLKPSGQVAEDEAQVEAALSPLTPTFQGVLKERLSRLAAKAQEYERHRESEDAALRAMEAAGVSSRSPAEAIAVIAKERAAAVADNAALLAFVNGHADVVCEDVVRQCGECDSCIARALIDVVHPGAALLEQHRKEVAQARNEGLEDAAQYFDKAANLWASFHAGTIAAQHAEAIRAMKTCTDGSCAKCRSGEPCH